MHWYSWHIQKIGYGSIPIDTFLVGWTSIYIHLPAILGWTKGTRVLTHPQLRNHTWTMDGFQLKFFCQNLWTWTQVPQVGGNFETWKKPWIFPRKWHELQIVKLHEPSISIHIYVSLLEGSGKLIGMVKNWSIEQSNSNPNPESARLLHPLIPICLDQWGLDDPADRLRRWLRRF